MAYIFQRFFLGGLFLEGPIFGGTYLRGEIYVTKSIGLAYTWKVKKKNYMLPYRLPCFILHLRVISTYKQPGGDLTEGSVVFRVLRACIWRGLSMEGLTFGILRHRQ